MAIIALPAKFSFTRVSNFALSRRTNVLPSRYTGVAQRVVYPYAVWQLAATLLDYDGPEAAAIRSFFVQLEGKKNTFRLPVPGFVKTGYQGTVNLSVAAAARAQSVTVSGGPASTAYLADGDFITIQDELKVVTGSVAFNGAGVATINFKPGLRKPAIVGTSVISNAPTVILHSDEDDAASWGLKPPFRHDLEIKAIEAVEL